MSTSQALTNLVISLIGIAAYFWPGGKPGAFIAGACCVLVLLATIGYRKANQAAERMDKKHRDFYNQKTSTDGD